MMQKVRRTLKISSDNCVTEMCSLGEKFNCDKSPLNKGRFRHAYTPVYQFLFSGLKYRKIGIVEIGIAEGAGLQVLRNFFPNAELIGLEKQDKFIDTCQSLALKNTIIKKCNVAESNEFENCLSGLKSPLDIIIDDSSHELVTQVNAIKIGVKYLASGGILIIEDIPRGKGREEKLISAIEEIRNLISFYTFIETENSKTFTGHWDNEQLLIIYKK